MCDPVSHSLKEWKTRISDIAQQVAVIRTCKIELYLQLSPEQIADKVEISLQGVYL